MKNLVLFLLTGMLILPLQLQAEDEGNFWNETDSETVEELQKDEAVKIFLGLINRTEEDLEVDK